MNFRRREFIANAASLAALAAVPPTLAQEVLTPAPSGSGPESIPPPATPAARARYQEIGEATWLELHRRLATANADMSSRGLLRIAGIDGTFLTGSPSNEFYDWDLYFENIYLSSYGVWPYCITNLKEFLNRQQPDG